VCIEKYEGVVEVLADDVVVVVLLGEQEHDRPLAVSHRDGAQQVELLLQVNRLTIDDGHEMSPIYCFPFAGLTLLRAGMLAACEVLAGVLDADAALPVASRFPHGRPVLPQVPEQFV
jgi:hypothetical protein